MNFKYYYVGGGTFSKTYHAGWLVVEATPAVSDYAHYYVSITIAASSKTYHVCWLVVEATPAVSDYAHYYVSITVQDVQCRLGSTGGHAFCQQPRSLLCKYHNNSVQQDVQCRLVITEGYAFSQRSRSVLCKYDRYCV